MNAVPKSKSTFVGVLTAIQEQDIWKQDTPSLGEPSIAFVSLLQRQPHPTP